MTSNHTHSTKVKNNQILQKKLQKINFKKHEITSGFRQREPRKINGKLIIVTFLLMGMKGRNTFQQWACHISSLVGVTVSKQGLWKRVNERFTKFLHAVLLDLLEQQLLELREQLKNYKRYPVSYKRILLQDSTTLALPDWLRYCYPGNFSRGKMKAQLKLQVIYDIVSECFIHFEITSFNVNDQSKAKDIITLANPGDLVIRDLGYFVLESFKEMTQGNVDFISRLRYGLNIYTVTGQKPVQLLKILKRKGYFNNWVIIGKKQKLKVRLVAIKLTKEQAEKRRRKAKRDRDKRLNHSKEYYELLGYNLFITNSEHEAVSPKQIQSLYGMRWRIETIFRCWKSYFHLQKLIPKNTPLTKERVESIIYMFLIFILLFHTTFYNNIRQNLSKDDEKILSLSKLCQFISNHIELFIIGDYESILLMIKYYCAYDKRNDRKNYVQYFNLS